MSPRGPGDGSLLQELRGRLDPGGHFSCACGRQHRIAADDVLVAGDATFGAAALLRRRYGASPTIWVLSDENTETAAGARWKSACGAAKLRSRVLPAVPRPIPSLELAEALAAEAIEHAQRWASQDELRDDIEALGRPTVELPLQTGQMDVGSLFELAGRLEDHLRTVDAA